MTASRTSRIVTEILAALAAVLVLLIAVPVFALVFFVTLDEPPRRV